eukprot:342914-Amphidinium_carterae.2
MERFYNPKLYVPPPKRELSEDEAIGASFGVAPPPTAPPGGIAGARVRTDLGSKSQRLKLPKKEMEANEPYTQQALNTM